MDCDRAPRVRVYTPGGVQIGLAGMGCGPDNLTFPQRFRIGDALSAPHWARFATIEEPRALGGLTGWPGATVSARRQ